jgi:hypothetical protein
VRNRVVLWTSVGLVNNRIVVGLVNNRIVVGLVNNRIVVVAVGDGRHRGGRGGYGRHLVLEELRWKSAGFGNGKSCEASE